MTVLHALVAGLRVELAFGGPAPDVVERWTPFATPPAGNADVSLVLRPGRLGAGASVTGRVVLRDGLWRVEGLEDSGWLDPATGRGEAVADPALLVAEALVRAALAQSVQARGGALFHASAVRVDGEAHLVPGRSGSGKSTFSALAGHVLTDELAAVLPGPEGFVVHGTPWWRSAGGSAPLAAVHLLAWDEPSVAWLPRARLLRHLATNVVIPVDGPAERAAAFRACGVIAAAAPFARTAFRPDTDVDALLRRASRRAA